MRTITRPTYAVRLYIAGDAGQAKAALRRACYPPRPGLCVTVEPTTFVYTGGQEEGVVVGFVDYPRFPQEPPEVYARAREIAAVLLKELCQMSCLLVATDKTEWLSLRPEDNKS